MSEKQCPICKLESPEIRKSRISGYDKYQYSCPRCGDFVITRLILLYTEKNSYDPKLIPWIRNRKEEGSEPPNISSDTIENILYSLPKYSPSDKQLVLLRNIERKTKYPGEIVDFDNNLDFPLAWSENGAEFQYYFKALFERGLIESLPTSETSSAQITPDGWDYLDENRKLKINSDQVFVAMSFSPELKNLYDNVIKPAIEKAGYKAYRVDDMPHIERIDSKIITEIKNSKFLIADVTGQKQGVYFEAGYAIGLGLPVIWSVKKDEINKVHFDTRQYFHNVWETEGELLDMLYNSICAVIGKNN